MLATGVTIVGLSRHDIKNTAIPVPSVEEQSTICRWISDQSQPIDEAIRRTEEEIKLIREYRDRLIADVVTGQVDVRRWQPGPDDVVAEEGLVALAGDEDIDTNGEDEYGEE